jgi:hypothetical protein
MIIFHSLICQLLGLLTLFVRLIQSIVAPKMGHNGDYKKRTGFKRTSLSAEIK